MASSAVQHALWRGAGRMANGNGKLQRLVASKGIVVFVGPNGSGKSLLAVEALLHTLQGIPWECEDLEHLHNRPVRLHLEGDERQGLLPCPACDVSLVEGMGPNFCPEGWALLGEHGKGVRLAWSTLPLLDAATGRPHSLYRPLRNIRQLVAIEHADVLFDEVAGVSDASDSATMPAGLTRWLQQLRKRDVLLRVTTPAYDRCSKPIRQVATLVVDCRSFFEEDSETGRLWRPRRAMLAKAYDAFEFGNFNKNSGDRLPNMATWFYWRTDHPGMRSYNTLAQVHALVDVTDSGVCTTCNGSRGRPTCGCDPSVHDLPYDEVEVIEVTGPKGGRQRKAVPVAQLAATVADPGGPTEWGPGEPRGVPGAVRADAAAVPPLGAVGSAGRHVSPVADTPAMVLDPVAAS